MSKEIEKLFGVVAICLLFLLVLWVAHTRIKSLQKELDAYKNASADTVVVTHIDTIFSEKPVPVYKYISRTEFVKIPSDSVRIDTVKELVFLPREYLVYKDSTYRAVVSGIEPRLDSIEIYRPTITNTITKTVVQKRKTRWGLGLQAGYGYNGKDFKPYIGIGVQYNVIAW